MVQAVLGIDKYTQGLNGLIPHNTELAVHNFLATIDPMWQKVNLSWENPTDPTWTYTVVLKRFRSFAVDYNDPLAKVIYQGQGNSFVDTIVSPLETIYYVAFGIQIAGTFPNDPAHYLITNVINKLTNQATWVTPGSRTQSFDYGWDWDSQMSIFIPEDYDYASQMYGDKLGVN